MGGSPTTQCFLLRDQAPLSVRLSSWGVWMMPVHGPLSTLLAKHVTSACYQHLSRSVRLTHLENSKHMFISAEEPAITVQFTGPLQPRARCDGADGPTPRSWSGLSELLGSVPLLPPLGREMTPPSASSELSCPCPAWVTASAAPSSARPRENPKASVFGKEWQQVMSERHTACSFLEPNSARATTEEVVLTK